MFYFQNPGDSNLVVALKTFLNADNTLFSLSKIPFKMLALALIEAVSFFHAFFAWEKIKRIAGNGS